jgi:BirA family biotin operon repressor/biotin-[acetyl-CoA-carboxylase] ligase
MPRFEREAIKQALTTSTVGQEVHFWPAIGSTMDAARQLADDGAPEGTLALTDEQTAGRGRLQRSWWAPPGTSLLMTLVLRPDLSPVQAQRLVMVCSLAVCAAIRKVTGLVARVKWPNDVLIEGKKVCGILTELGITGSKLDYVLVGMGINVNCDFSQAPEMMSPPTSLRMETGHDVSRLDLLTVLLSEIERRYEALRQGRFDQNEWAAHLETIGREVTVSSGDERWAGLATGVDEDGALLIRLPDESVQRVLAGDVTLREHG